MSNNYRQELSDPLQEINQTLPNRKFNNDPATIMNRENNEELSNLSEKSTFPEQMLTNNEKQVDENDCEMRLIKIDDIIPEDSNIKNDKILPNLLNTKPGLPSINNRSRPKSPNSPSHASILKQISLNTASSSGTTPLAAIIPKSTSKSPTYQRAPDGGWGWAVVLASFIISFIADGVSLSFGVIYVELIEYFNESKSKTAWVGSLFFAIPLLSGPIASALADNFGCRKMTIAGAIFASAGFFFGQFSTRIEHLFIAFSFAGFGLSLVYVTSMVSVAYWFDKRRSLANGLASCGTGFGTFLFAPLIIYLLREYKWRGTLLVLSAVHLNIICCGFLIRDIDIENFDSSSSTSSRANTSDLESNLSDSINEMNNFDCDIVGNDPVHWQNNLPLNEHGHRLLLKSKILSEYQLYDKSIPRHTASLFNIPTYIQYIGSNNNLKNRNDNESINSNFGEVTFCRGGYLYNLICLYPHLLDMFLRCDMQGDDLTVKTKVKSAKLFDQKNNSPALQSSQIRKDLVPKLKMVEFGSIHHIDSNAKMNEINNSKENKNVNGINNDNVTQSLTNTTSRIGQFFHFIRPNLPQSNLQFGINSQQRFSGNHLHHLRLPRGSLTYRNAMLIINKYRLKASSAPDIYRTSMVTINEGKSSTFWTTMRNVLSDMVDFSNFKSIRYSIFCLSNFLLYACIDVPYVYIPDQVTTSGASDKDGASKYISIIGVFNTFGVVVIGYIGDKKWMDASFLNALLLSISGLSMLAFPLTNRNYIIITLSAIYGFSISANYSLIPVILVELISLDSFTTSYGLLLLVQGFASLIGPPLAGWLFDVSGSYDIAFYITGITILLSGFLMIPVGRKKNCIFWKNAEKSSIDEDSSSIFDIISNNADDIADSKIKKNTKYNQIRNHNKISNNNVASFNANVEEDSKI